MAANDLISVIVTTYNRPDALDAVLRALGRQSDQNFEIVVADDGSEPETARVIAQWTPRLGMPLRHVWQTHNGFRGGEVRNLGIRESAAPYCIFLDGDCLTPRHFIAVHRRLAEPGWFVAGNRILLSEGFTRSVIGRGLAVETWNIGGLVAERLRGGVNRLLPATHLPLGPLRKLHGNDWKGAKTCNLAVFRRDLDRIDGFDMAYVGWGFEDSDLVVRLLKAGTHRKDGRFATGVLHLWHPEADRSRLHENERRLANALGGNRIWATKGLSTLHAQSETSTAVS